MPTKEIQIAQLIWQTRRLFQRLTNESNDVLATFEITASQRAVLEFLDHNEPETLANIARAHDVSRQHIQQIVNELLDKQLVRTIDNPSHKRSFLVQRTKKGSQLFTDIKILETTLFNKITQEFTSKDLQTSIDTLKNFNNVLQSEHWLELKEQVFEKEI